MALSREDWFRSAVGSVFNSWTALQLAVEHGMGGPQGVPKALGMIDAVVDLFKKNCDLLDEEFNTICEDESPDEIGVLVCELYQLCSSGDREQVEAGIARLPKCKSWLASVSQTPAGNSQDDDEDEDSEEEGEAPRKGEASTSAGHNSTNDAAMDAEVDDPDPGWTQVQRRRR